MNKPIEKTSINPIYKIYKIIYPSIWNQKDSVLIKIDKEKESSTYPVSLLALRTPPSVRDFRDRKFPSRMPKTRQFIAQPSRAITRQRLSKSRLPNHIYYSHKVKSVSCHIHVQYPSPFKSDPAFKQKNPLHPKCFGRVGSISNGSSHQNPTVKRKRLGKYSDKK